jgi:hypothetical protein
METLLYQEKYDKIQKVTQKYQLLEKDSSYQKRPVYLPTITWYVHVAAFRVGQLSKYDFRTIILDYTEFVKTDKYKFTQAEILLKTIQPHIPEVIQLVRPKLYDLGIRI